MSKDDQNSTEKEKDLPDSGYSRETSALGETVLSMEHKLESRNG